MISKARIKQIHSLERKKNRLTEGLFVGEGPKLVGECLSTLPVRYVAATEEWLSANGQRLKGVPCDVVSNEELHRISLQQHP
ncbi:MAG: RNA methyltransferase, partial [Bacteroidaceae bacterium]|nr:RNA methyltransferase [Bacteroidaceae bacterium]